MEDSRISGEDFHRFKAYAAGVFSNCGNLRGFGDTKFVPEISPQTFTEILSLAESAIIDRILPKILSRVYSTQFSPGLNSAYYSPNISLSEAQLVTQCLE